jgi:hypothetical protein
MDLPAGAISADSLGPPAPRLRSRDKTGDVVLTVRWREALMSASTTASDCF